MGDTAFWRQIDLVGIASKIGHKGDDVLILIQDTATIGLFGGNNIREQIAIGFLHVALRSDQCLLNSFKDKIGSIYLTMRMRVRDAYHLALVFKAEDMLDVGAFAEIVGLLLPDLDQLRDFRVWHFGNSEIVCGAIADDTSQARGSTYSIWWGWSHQRLRRIWSNTGMVIVKDIGRGIVWIDGPAYTLIART